MRGEVVVWLRVGRSLDGSKEEGHLLGGRTWELSTQALVSLGWEQHHIWQTSTSA